MYISSLAFISCGHNYSAAINVISVQQFNISYCSFLMNGGAIGGALYIHKSTVGLTGSIFQNSTADGSGGVLCAQESTLTVMNNTFQYNSADGGGGVLCAQESTLTVVDNTFQYNSADHDGGVLSVLHCTLTVMDNTFQYNSADQDGGVLYVWYSTLTVMDNTFQYNYAIYSSGGVLNTGYSTLTVMDNTFQFNSAGEDGGVLYVYNAYSLYSTLAVLTGNTFRKNSANLGGIIYMGGNSIKITNNTFTDSSAVLGGAIFMTDNSMASMYGSNIIANNTAQYGGGIAALDSQLQLFNTVFENNTASYGGGLYAHNTTCNGNALFTKNEAFEGGGGIYASKSTFFWTENTTVIKSNSAIDGGGLLLSDDSKLYLQPNIAVHLISNHANRTGGAIKVKESNPLTYCIPSTNGHDVSKSDCFFQIQFQMKHAYSIGSISELKNCINSLDVAHIKIHFDNNSAVEAGSDLYGGNVDSCTLNINVKIYPVYSGPAFSGYVFDVMTRSATISSDPLDICTCVDHLINCTGFYHPEPVYPGGTLEVPVIARGQRNGITVAVVQVIETSNNFNVSNLEISQNILNSCTPLKYTIQSCAVGSTQEMTLYAEGPCPPTKTNTLTVTVDIQSCPPGFQLSEAQSICICVERLQQFTNTCLIDNATVLRTQNAEFWVGYDNKSQGIILHPHCPFDYCTSNEVYLAVDDSDKQCNYNRSGLMCGRCSDNLSLALGSSRCLQCSNSYLSLLAAFAFAGIALLLLLLVLRLTVAVGTINGLIFYANIVAVNSQIFFQHQSNNVPTALTDKALTLFVAWLNLDLGIETCFYKGMDAYGKTWLQFAFPLYVWALAGMIIIGSYYSGKVAKVFGSNPVAVLATLFLLSYAKLFRTVIAALSYTSLEYPNNSHIAVWQYDGNIPYLSSKHIPLFTAAMVFLIILFLPYMILLVLGQWLQAKSHFRILSWIKSPKIKFLLDTYHAPYTDKHRYWTGLMLLFRFVLFLISAVNALGDPSVNLLAIISTTVAILTLPTILGSRIYKTWSLGLLETSFVVNLAILAAATSYIQRSGGTQNAATLTSVSVAFVTFTGIVIYHSVQQIKGTRLWRRVCLRHDYMRVPLTDVDAESADPPDSPVEFVYMSGSAPTQTVVDIRDSELREPCMATD